MTYLSIMTWVILIFLYSRSLFFFTLKSIQKNQKIFWISENGPNGCTNFFLVLPAFLFAAHMWQLVVLYME